MKLKASCFPFILHPSAFILSLRRGEDRADLAEAPLRVAHLFEEARHVLPRPLGEERLPAVGVLEAVLAREVPGAENLAGLLQNLRVCGESSDGAAGEEWRLGLDKRRVLLRALAPVLLGDAHVFEHRLGAKEAGRERDRRDLVLA